MDVVAIIPLAVTMSDAMSSHVADIANIINLPAHGFIADGGASSEKAGRAYVYVLPCRYEKILTLGFSCDPLERMFACHSRYFEFFNLNRAFAIEIDGVNEARRMKRFLAAPLQEQRAPTPLIREEAASYTEWYRGAYELLAQQGKRAQHEGYRLLMPLKRWVREQLELRSHLLFYWSRHMLEEIERDASTNSMLSAALQRRLADALDALSALKIPPERYVSASVLEWRSRLPYDFFGKAAVSSPWMTKVDNVA